MKNKTKKTKLSGQAVLALKTIMKKYMEDGTVLVHMSLTEKPFDVDTCLELVLGGFAKEEFEVCEADGKTVFVGRALEIEKHFGDKWPTSESGLIVYARIIVDPEKVHAFLEPHWKIKTFVATHIHMLPAILPAMLGYMWIIYFSWKIALGVAAVVVILWLYLTWTVSWSIKVEESNRKLAFKKNK